MSTPDQARWRRRDLQQGQVQCPAWCRGCTENDPMHRSEIDTVGREASGWVSFELALDRFARRELMLKIHATRDGATQTVLLTEAQADRLIRRLTQVHHAMRLTRLNAEQGRETT